MFWRRSPLPYCRFLNTTFCRGTLFWKNSLILNQQPGQWGDFSLRIFSQFSLVVNYPPIPLQYLTKLGPYSPSGTAHCALSQKTVFEYLHINQACHGWRRCNGICLVVRAMMYGPKSQTYTVAFAPAAWQARFNCKIPYYFCHSAPQSGEWVIMKFVGIFSIIGADNNFSPSTFLPSGGTSLCTVT